MINDTRQIAIRDLGLVRELQSRHQDEADKQSRWLVDEYAEAMIDGNDFPPIEVFLVGGKPFVVDGFHRISAALQAGKAFVTAKAVGSGTMEDAQWYSLTANQAHGYRRTNKDKFKIIRTCLAHRRSHGMSDREVARYCKVYPQLVAKIRADMAELNLTEVSPFRAPETPPEVTRPDVPKAAPNQTPEPGCMIYTPAKVPESLDSALKPWTDPDPTPPAPMAPASKTPLMEAMDVYGAQPKYRYLLKKPAPEGMPPREPFVQANALLHTVRAKLMAIAKVCEWGSEHTDYLRYIKEAEYHFAYAIPDICPLCEGPGCEECGGKGWMDLATIYQIKTRLEKEARQRREAAGAAE